MTALATPASRASTSAAALTAPISAASEISSRLSLAAQQPAVARGRLSEVPTAASISRSTLKWPPSAANARLRSSASSGAIAALVTASAGRRAAKERLEDISEAAEIGAVKAAAQVEALEAGVAKAVIRRSLFGV